MAKWKVAASALCVTGSLVGWAALAEPVKTWPFLGTVDGKKGVITYSGGQYQLLSERELRVLLAAEVTLTPTSGFSEWQVFSPNGSWRVLHRGRVESRGNGRWLVRRNQICVAEAKSEVCQLVFRGDRDELYLAVPNRTGTRVGVYSFRAARNAA